MLLESLDALAHGAALGAEQPHQLGPGGGGASRHWLLPLDGLFLVTSGIGRSQIYPCQKCVTLFDFYLISHMELSSKKGRDQLNMVLDDVIAIDMF